MKICAKCIAYNLSSESSIFFNKIDFFSDICIKCSFKKITIIDNNIHKYAQIFHKIIQPNTHTFDTIFTQSSL